MQLDVTVDVSQAVAGLQRSVEQLVPAVARGLARGIDYVAGIAQRVTATALRVITGTLANTVEGRVDAGSLSGTIGVHSESPAIRYAYLLDDGGKTITPVRARFLTIPTQYNLTGAGAPRWPSVAALEAGNPDAQKRGLVWRKGAVGVIIGSLATDRDTKGRLFGKRATGARFVPMFWLRTSVRVEGRNVLGPTVRDNAGIIRDEIGSEIERLVA